MGSSVRAVVVLLVFGIAAASCGDEPMMYEVSVLVVAGPTCPVQKDPPDPACADRPVAGAEIRVLNRGGKVLTSAVTTEGGLVSVRLKEGSYRLEPQPVEGLMGTAQPLDILVTRGGVAPSDLTFVYDTGVR